MRVQRQPVPHQEGRGFAGDDVVDADPVVHLAGFGLEDTHSVANSLRWGPDGWLYGCHGVFTHSKVGKPGTPDNERIPLNAAIWRYHPTRHEFEIFTEGTSNPWGVDFNDYGDASTQADLGITKTAAARKCTNDQEGA